MILDSNHPDFPVLREITLTPFAGTPCVTYHCAGSDLLIVMSPAAMLATDPTQPHLALFSFGVQAAHPICQDDAGKEEINNILTTILETMNTGMLLPGSLDEAEAEDASVFLDFKIKAEQAEDEPCMLRGSMTMTLPADAYQRAESLLLKQATAVLVLRQAHSTVRATDQACH